MSSAAVGVTPSARTLRRRVRRARRAHHGRSLGDALNDLYTLLWVFGVYGGIAVTAIVRHLRRPAAPLPVETHWLLVAALLLAAGVAWWALRMVGPVLATPAERTWALSSPVDRGGWLRPRMLLLLFGVGAGAALAATIAAVVVRSGAIGGSALAGAAAGVALAASAVTLQRVGEGAGRWAALPGVLLVGSGLATAAVAVVARRTGMGLPHPAASAPLLLAATGVPLAAFAVFTAWRALGRLDAAALGAGAQVASAGATAAVGLDLSLLLDVLEVRRWRRVGTVRSRPFHAWPGARWMVLLEAEARRLLRRPDALAIGASLALAQYALAMAAPSSAVLLRPILAYVAANRLTAGLRTLSRAPGLARALGVGEGRLRALHMVVPALVVAAWWAVTAPTSATPPGRLDLALVVGVVGSAYRAATRPPMSYEGMALETPFGLLPVDMVRQLLRGPDLLGATIVLRLLVRG